MIEAVKRAIRALREPLFPVAMPPTDSEQTWRLKRESRYYRLESERLRIVLRSVRELSVELLLAIDSVDLSDGGVDEMVGDFDPALLPPDEEDAWMRKVMSDRR